MARGEATRRELCRPFLRNDERQTATAQAARWCGLYVTQCQGLNRSPVGCDFSQLTGGFAWSMSQASIGAQQQHKLGSDICRVLSLS